MIGASKTRAGRCRSRGHPRHMARPGGTRVAGHQATPARLHPRSRRC